MLSRLLNCVFTRLCAHSLHFIVGIVAHRRERLQKDLEAIGRPRRGASEDLSSPHKPQDRSARRAVSELSPN